MSEPAIIAPILKNIVGNRIFVSALLIWWAGEEHKGDHTTLIMRRNEYLIVHMVARNNIKKITQFIGLKIAVSKIISFE